jgi:hypothetical protein
VYAPRSKGDLELYGVWTPFPFIDHVFLAGVNAQLEICTNSTWRHSHEASRGAALTPSLLTRESQVGKEKPCPGCYVEAREQHGV